MQASKLHVVCCSLFFTASYSVSSLADSAQTLEPIIITAARAPQTWKEVLAPTSVLTREEIETHQFQSVGQALASLPGVMFSNQGGTGKITSIFLRGSNADHVLVLIDGIKVGSVTAGTTAFQDLPIESVERIEVVRGPMSSLYGAEAVGGIIQIFTRKANNQQGIQVSATVGSENTTRGSVTLQQSNQEGWVSYNLKQENTDGINACQGDTSKGCFTVEPDKDGYSQQAHNLSAGWQLTDDTQAEVHWLRSDANNEYDGGFSNQAKDRQQVFSGQVNSQINNAWNSSWILGQSQDDSRNLLNGDEKSKFNTQKNSITWLNQIRLNTAIRLIAGLDYLQDKINQSSTAYDTDHRNNTGVFALLHAQKNSTLWEVSARQDHNEQFGDYNTGTLRWGMDLPRNLRVVASWGNAFKAPTFNDLYYNDPNDTFYHGNPNLVPEKSRTKEIGLDYFGLSTASLHLFQTDFTNLIQLNDNFDSSINVGQAQVTGLEAQWNNQWQSGWQLNSQATFLQPESKTAATDGHWLPRRSRQQLDLDLSYPWKAWVLGAQLFAQGKRYDNLANTVILPGYALLNLRADYALAKDWKLQASVSNLLDRDYQTVAQYNQPGREFLLSLSYNGIR